MGCDGGTIPTRDELVRVKKKPEKKDKDCLREAKWLSCSLSQERLRPPIVACQLGRLYNKESVVKALLARTKVTGAEHVKTLKDVRELNLTENPEYVRAAYKGDGYTDKMAAPYICPVVGIGMNGKYRFCFTWSCGCVLSERALKEVKSDVCHKCGKVYDSADVIPLNPSEEELPALRQRETHRRQLAREAKKAKKAEKHKLDDGKEMSASEPASKRKPAPDDDVSKPKAPSSRKHTASLVLDRAACRSVQDDPGASKVYKNLFTTSSEAKREKTGHWITYNPQYY